MIDWLRKLIVGKIEMPEHPILDERERQLDEVLSRVSGKTAQEIRQDIRRRALELEVQSMRRR